ncbi:MAG: thiamine-phosphate kinase [Candidatus Methanoplasma sp.]|jgi:thiamine-monophosphate kinase|nr:thiamine-phosphate kinase [Candidatus Methanoplasma sp.]
MASIGDVGERALVKKIIGMIRPCGGIGPGDDAAVFEAGGAVAASTDRVSFDRHFPKGMSFEQFGWTAAAVNFSDLAAMGARPFGLLASMAMPRDMDEESLYDMASGMDECANLCGARILGGDTKFGDGSITCTALGSMGGRSPLLRSGASPGEMVAVTGRLGGAAAAFAAIEAGAEDECDMGPLYAPSPRIGEGEILSASGLATSCMDLSDGLANAAESVCAASHVGMEIEMGFIPESPYVEAMAEVGLDRREALLRWGGDYELMFTFKKEGLSALSDSGLDDFSIIGMVTNGDGAYICDGGDRARIGDARY